MPFSLEKPSLERLFFEPEYSALEAYRYPCRIYNPDHVVREWFSFMSSQEKKRDMSFLCLVAS